MGRTTSSSDVCVIAANTFINLRRIRIVTCWINRLANELFSLSLLLYFSITLSESHFLSGSHLPTVNRSLSALFCQTASNWSRSIPIAIVQL